MDTKIEKKAYKEVSHYMVGNVSVAILGFAISLLYSRMFDPEAFGIYSQVSGVYSLIVQIYGGWMISSIQRYAPQYIINNEKEQFYGSFCVGHVFMAVVFLLVGNLLLLVYPFSDLYRILIFIYAFVYLVEELMMIFCAFLQVEGKSARYSNAIVLKNFFKVILILWLYYFCDVRSVVTIVLGIFLTELIQCVWLAISNRYWSFFRIEYFRAGLMKQMMQYGLPLMGVAVTTWVLNVSDRYVIGFYCLAADVGIYSYAYSIAHTLFYTLMQGVILGAYPRIVTKWETEGAEGAQIEIAKYWRMFLLLILPCCVGAICVSQDFFRALIADQYYDGYRVFAIIAVSMFVLGCTQFTNKIWELRGDTKRVLVLNIIAAVTNIVLNFLLIPVLGYIVAAYTTVAAQIIYVIVSVIWSQKIFTFDWRGKAMVRIGVSAGVMAAATYVPNVFMQAGMVRLVIKVTFGIVVYAAAILVSGEITREEICSVLNKRR